VTVLKFERLKVTLATCFPKIYQTDTKLLAKEQYAARQTHASPSCDLNAANGAPNDADQRKNGQKLASLQGLFNSGLTRLLLRCK